MAGRLAAYGAESCGVDTGSTVVQVRRLTDGRTLFTHPATSAPGPESYTTVSAIAADRAGDVAWIARTSSIVAPCRRHDRLCRSSGSSIRRLDSGGAIVATSLRLTGTTVRWRNGSRSRSGPALSRSPAGSGGPAEQKDQPGQEDQPVRTMQPGRQPSQYWAQTELAEGRAQGAAHVRERVLDAHRRTRVDPALDQAPCLGLLQALGEEPVGEVGARGGDLGEAQRSGRGKRRIAPVQRRPISSTASW